MGLTPKKGEEIAYLINKDELKQKKAIGIKDINKLSGKDIYLIFVAYKLCSLYFWMLCFLPGLTIK